ncbi:hypothetical protein OESDEN_05526 [Oesophagostomum dentatum]|uniref:Uncharacterized protein n=1 Tax=Oesophagostomum dentatum TaxID=61180 RepID=A0A0B1TEK8_OESDE|nr:hypothetical protein OESDEN_05526 [Oesophagostomum dentatum]
MSAFRATMQLRCFSAAVQTSNPTTGTRGRFQSWKKPVYVAPHTNPLEVGPDFSVVGGERTVYVTSKKQLEYKLDQIRLAKKAVQLLSQVKEMEKAHKEAEARRLSESQKAELLRPKAKGTKSIS